MSISTVVPGLSFEALATSTIDNDGSVCEREIKSDTEEYFETLTIDGQEYRRKMTKRIVFEKVKTKEFVYLPQTMDGSGPDFTKIHETNNTVNMSQESRLDTNQLEVPDLPAFRRFAEDRFRVSGNKFLPRPDNIKKLTVATKADSQNALMDNYMHVCGLSEFQVPIIDTRLSTQILDAINSEWFKSQEIDLPNEKSKTISYFKESFSKNENGSSVYNLFEKTKSRTLRVKPDNIMTKPALAYYPANNIYATSSLEHSDSRDESYDDNGGQITDIRRHGVLDSDDEKNINCPMSRDRTETESPSNISDICDSYCDESVIEAPTDTVFDLSTGSQNLNSCHYSSEDQCSFILTKDNPRPYLIFDDDAKHGECDIAGGPVDALIVHACDGKEHLLFLGAFLDTYRTFIKPEDLINRLIIRYKFFRSKISLGAEDVDFTSEANENDTRESRTGSPDDDPKRKCIHVLSLLLTIISKLKKDFTDSIKIRLKLFEEYLRNNNEQLWILSIMNAIRTSKESMEKDNEKVQLLRELHSRLPSKSTENLRTKITISDFSSREIAEQMTLLDWIKYRDVELIEVLNLKDIAGCKLTGVIEYAKHFQNVQQWTQSILLDPAKRTSDRDKYYSKFYQIMKNLRKLNNFSSYIAILLAIQLLPREKLFSKRIQVKIFEMESYMEPPRFIGYKEDLKQATAPCIPFLGLFYQEIVMLNIGNSQYLDLDDVTRASSTSNWTSNNNDQLLSSITDKCGPIINFWRSFKQYVFLKNCNKNQDKIRYSIKPNEKILKFLSNFQHKFDESTIQRLTKQM